MAQAFVQTSSQANLRSKLSVADAAGDKTRTKQRRFALMLGCKSMAQAFVQTSSQANLRSKLSIADAAGDKIRTKQRRFALMPGCNAPTVQ